MDKNLKFQTMNNRIRTIVIISYIFMLITKGTYGQVVNKPAFSTLNFGDIKPRGWILSQMQRDLQTGFAGHLDELCTEASNDIFGYGRNSPGKINGDRIPEQAWWNGESEGNWRSGHMMLACLTHDDTSMKKAKAYIDHILATQDTDGYIGIFSPELRYNGNGEFWTQTCLFRGMLAYADATGDENVYKAVKRAVDRTIDETSQQKVIQFIWHDNMYTDILEDLFTRTGDRKYLDFGLRIYNEFPNLSEFIQHPRYGENHKSSFFNAHGATSTEAMRLPFWLWAATGNKEYLEQGKGLIAEMSKWVLPSGGVVSQESIDRPPHPSKAAYEYCAITESHHSLISAGQKTGDAKYFQQVEQLFFNAAQGSREPDGSAILYCSYDNRLSIRDQIGTRQRFSPTHKQAAVCCNPNAARIAPAFISGAWMKPAGNEPSIAAVLFGPCEVRTEINGIGIKIIEETTYPYSGDVTFKINPEKEISFCLWLRDPEWSDQTKIICKGADIRKAQGYWQIRKLWKAGDIVEIKFEQTVRPVAAINQETALQYGPLLYVLPFKGLKETVLQYPKLEFSDYYVNLVQNTDTQFFLRGDKQEKGFGFKPHIVSGTNQDFPLDKPGLVLKGKMFNKKGELTPVILLPIGSKEAQLRCMTFPVR
jgi:hypothetical protein